MDINYVIVAAVLFVVILLIVFLIRRNQKDRKAFEKEVKDSELKPDKHEDNKV